MRSCNALHSFALCLADAQAAGVTPRIITRAESKLAQANKRKDTQQASRTGRMASGLLATVRRSGGEGQQTPEDLQMSGWIKKNQGGKAFEHGSVRRFFQQEGFQLRTYHDEARKGEHGVIDLRNVISLKRSRDPLVRDGVELTISVAGLLQWSPRPEEHTPARAKCTQQLLSVVAAGKPKMIVCSFAGEVRRLRARRHVQTRLSALRACHQLFQLSRVRVRRTMGPSGCAFGVPPSRKLR